MALVVLAVLALVASGCGSRLPDEVLAEIDSGSTGQAAGSGGGSGSSTDGQGDEDGIAAGPAAADDDGAAAPGETDAGDTPGGEGAAPAPGDPAAPAPGAPAAPGGQAAGGAACRGGATDKGVTAGEIKVGSMVTDSGPLPGATRGAFRGAAAYYAKINAEGGICGRKITVMMGDDALDPARARAEFTRLEPQVLAFAGNLSVADSGFIDLIEKTAVPYVGGTVDPAGEELPTVVPHGSGRNVISTGPFAYYKDAHPDVSKVAYLFSDVGGVRANTPGSKKAIRHEGYEIVYESGVQVTAPDFTPEVINMRAADADFVYLFAFEINMNIRMARNMRQQNYEPPIRIGTLSYNSRFIELLKDTANGWTNYIAYVPFLTEGEAEKNPALAEFLAWSERLFPGAQLDLFPQGGWGSAALLVEALRRAGPDVTRAKIVDIIDNQITEVDGGGLIPKGPPGQVSSCFVVVTVKSGKWVRDHPKSGYECELGEVIKF